MNHIEIPEEYKYILDRYGFECLRAVGNASFMLYKHINNPGEKIPGDFFLERRIYDNDREKRHKGIVLYP